MSASESSSAAGSELTSNIDKSIRVTGRLIELVGSTISAKDLHEVGVAAVDEIRSNIQNEGHVVTGETLASVGIYGESALSVSVGSDKESAIYLEYGRGPVRPVRAKALHFTSKDGDEVFTKYSGPAEATGVFERGVLAAVPRKIEEIAREKERQLQSEASS